MGGEGRESEGGEGERGGEGQGRGGGEGEGERESPHKRVKGERTSVN